MVAYGTAGAISPARYAVASQCGLRARVAPATRHLASLDNTNRRSRHLLRARWCVDLRRQARAGPSDAARVRSSWLDRGREQLPARPSLSLARSDGRCDAGARVDQEEHFDVR